MWKGTNMKYLGLLALLFIGCIGDEIVLTPMDKVRAMHPTAVDIQKLPTTGECKDDRYLVKMPDNSIRFIKLEVSCSGTFDVIIFQGYLKADPNAIKLDTTKVIKLDTTKASK